jgi:hypothetical protein
MKTLVAPKTIPLDKVGKELDLSAEGWEADMISTATLRHTTLVGTGSGELIVINGEQNSAMLYPIFNASEAVRNIACGENIIALATYKSLAICKTNDRGMLQHVAVIQPDDLPKDIPLNSDVALTVDYEDQHIAVVWGLNKLYFFNEQGEQIGKKVLDARYVPRMVFLNKNRLSLDYGLSMKHIEYSETMKDGD